MKKWNHQRVPLVALTAAALAAGSVIAVRAVMASDHQDTPLVELSPRYDVNDVYAFPAPSNPSRTVLVLGTSSPITPAHTPSFTFGTKDQELYQIKIDNTGDAREDLVFQITFTGKAGKQKVTLRGPIAPNTVGAMNTLVGGKQIKGTPTPSSSPKTSSCSPARETIHSSSISRRSSASSPIGSPKRVRCPRSRRVRSPFAPLPAVIPPWTMSVASTTWPS